MNTNLNDATQSRAPVNQFSNAYSHSEHQIFITARLAFVLADLRRD